MCALAWAICRSATARCSRSRLRFPMGGDGSTVLVFLISPNLYRAGWTGIAPFKFLFRVRSGTTRVRHRTMAEFTSARSGTRESSDAKPMDRWAEPPIHGGARDGWGLGKLILSPRLSVLPHVLLHSRQKSPSLIHPPAACVFMDRATFHRSILLQALVRGCPRKLAVRPAFVASPQGSTCLRQEIILQT